MSPRSHQRANRPEGPYICFLNIWKHKVPHSYSDAGEGASSFTKFGMTH